MTSRILRSNCSVNRRKWALPVSVASMTAVLLVACGEQGGTGEQGETQESEITLSVADSRSMEHYAVTDSVVPWMECIEDQTEGQVEFDHYPAEQLGGLSDHMALLRDGVADIAYVPPALFEGEMPLSEVHTIPGVFDDAVRSSEIFDEATRETNIHENDYESNGIRYLWGSMTVPSEIYSVDTPIETLDDIQGMTLRGSGGSLEAAIQRMGASTLTLPTPEVYQALETGTADGTIMATASVGSYSVYEVTQYATEGMQLGVFWMPMVIATDVWESLSEDTQDAFNVCNEDAVGAGAEVAEQVTEEEQERFESEGLTFTALAEEDMDRVAEIYADVAEEWVSDSADRAEVLDFIQERTSSE